MWCFHKPSLFYYCQTCTLECIDILVFHNSIFVLSCGHLTDWCTIVIMFHCALKVPHVIAIHKVILFYLVDIDWLLYHCYHVEPCLERRTIMFSLNLWYSILYFYGITNDHDMLWIPDLCSVTTSIRCFCIDWRPKGQVHEWTGGRNEFLEGFPPANDWHIHWHLIAFSLALHCKFTGMLQNKSISYDWQNFIVEWHYSLWFFKSGKTCFDWFDCDRFIVAVLHCCYIIIVHQYYLLCIVITVHWP